MLWKGGFMVHKIIMSVVITLICVYAQEQILQDVVYLKNGSVLKGQIIEQIPGEIIKLQTKDGNLFVFQVDEVEKIKREKVEVKEEYKIIKKPEQAFFLSLFPGGGQHYNGHHLKGLLCEVVSAGSWIVFFTIVRTRKTYSYWVDSTLYYGSYMENTPWRWIGLGGAIAASVYSLVDAPISAHRINKESHQKYGHLIEIQRDTYAIGIDILPIKNGIDARFTYHF